MIKVFGIGGAPTTGKTTLIKSVIPALGHAQPFNRGPIMGDHYPESKVTIIGKYDGSTRFVGSDRLTPGAVPVFLDALGR